MISMCLFPSLNWNLHEDVPNVKKTLSFTSDLSFSNVLHLKKKKKCYYQSARSKPQKPESTLISCPLHPSCIVYHQVLLILIPKYSLSQNSSSHFIPASLWTLALTSNWFVCIWARMSLHPISFYTCNQSHLFKMELFVYLPFLKEFYYNVSSDSWTLSISGQNQTKTKLGILNLFKVQEI